MDVGAWCGSCGESYRLAELVAGGFDGKCPRCGFAYADGYLPVASSAVHDVLNAAKSLHESIARLRDVAPRLHVDGRKLQGDLADVVGD